MSKITIYLGSKNKSSWSLRAWLMLLQTGVDFEAVFIQLDQPDSKEKIAKISPSAKVPVLKHGDHVIWDSLAIGEYLAEVFPRAKLWPQDQNLRALARSISCEMHAGFQALRSNLPFNPQGKMAMDISNETHLEIQRVFHIWQECRTKYGEHGKFLFGNFTIADAMFAPITSRFITYNVDLPPLAKDYVGAIMELPEMKMWCNEV